MAALPSGSLKRGEEVGRSVTLDDITKTTFTSLGSYKSSELGREVYVGLKEYPRREGKNLKTALRNNVVRDLSVIRAIAERFPHLEEELPLFYGLLLDSQGNYIGMLTEDFSRGKRYEVKQGVLLDVPSEIEPLFEHRSKVEYEGVVEMVFLVDTDDGEERRFGDFNTVLGGISPDERNRIFPLADIVEFGEDKYTLRLDYELG